ncbi:MAG: PAAR domain-containing protein [Oscillospiraceae bacterium]|nr:PAAR domain-containing protein [Oscillospiraceae bacterium]
MGQVARRTDTHRGVCDHGEGCCPHSVSGTITGGSPNVTVGGLGVARMDDPVTHSCPHCGTGRISSASGSVTVNGRGAARVGDSVTYPGGSGTITSGSANASFGD